MEKCISCLETIEKDRGLVLKKKLARAVLSVLVLNEIEQKEQLNFSKFQLVLIWWLTHTYNSQELLRKEYTQLFQNYTGG